MEPLTIYVGCMVVLSLASLKILCKKVVKKKDLNIIVFINLCIILNLNVDITKMM